VSLLTVKNGLSPSISRAWTMPAAGFQQLGALVGDQDLDVAGAGLEMRLDLRRRDNGR
jgi:hypothetical protein